MPPLLLLLDEELELDELDAPPELDEDELELLLDELDALELALDTELLELDALELPDKLDELPESGSSDEPEPSPQAISKESRIPPHRIREAITRRLVLFAAASIFISNSFLVSKTSKNFQ